MNTIVVLLVVISIHFKASNADCRCQHEYKRVGCFKDKKHDRALPEMLANERDKHSRYYNNYDINWADWANYMPQMVCRCAEQALKKGYRYFGLQFWGECWSGSSLDYDKHGTGAACYGPEFKMCHENDINCVGDNSHNFVYEIETYTCDVNFEKIGCYQDKFRNNDLALTARDHKSAKYMGQSIDWWNYDIFLPKFACECAKKVAEKGHSIFGLQYYGECWTGQNLEQMDFSAQPRSPNCINKCYENCNRWDRFCIGKGHTNTIYRITHPKCEIKYESLGCYNAVDKWNNEAMSELLIDQVSPSSKKFNGKMLPFDDTWEAEYKTFLCRCSWEAQAMGYDTFAIRNKGECWGGSKAGNPHDQYGASKNCVRKESDPCDDDMMCAGDENSMNVYKILGKTIQIGK